MSLLSHKLSVILYPHHSKAGKLHRDIPSSPNKFYKEKGWFSWGDWLGTGSVHPKDKKFKLFEEAREHARSLGLKNIQQWKEYSKEGKLPRDIPRNPCSAYKGKGWVTWGDWLGTGNIKRGGIQYKSLHETKEWARVLGIKTQQQWKKCHKAGKLPSDIPGSPDSVYKGKGWISWGDFLGKGNRQFESFEEAREWARTSGIKTLQEWNNYIKAGKLPSNIPRSPDGVYKDKGWASWSDWLGTGNRQFKSFEEGRQYARSLGLKNIQQWKEYSKAKKLPRDIPCDPYKYYKRNNKFSWDDWLGTGNVHPRDRQFKSFEEGRQYARSLGLKTRQQWREYSKAGKLPNDIPGSPDNSYKKDGKFSWADWLGTGNIKRGCIQYKSLQETKEWARVSGIKTQQQWKKHHKAGKLPSGMPVSPDKVYKGKGWISWGDLLGTGNIHPKNRQFKSFEEARKWMRASGIKSSTQWIVYRKTVKLPNDIPTNPNKIYKGKGWISWGDWLGTRNRQFKSFEEGREWARASGIKTLQEWNDHIKAGKLPSDLPFSPNNVYKGKGWVSWGNWLGTGNVHPRDRQYKPFEEAGEYARSLGLKTQQQWREHSKAGKLPNDIPRDPYKTNKGKGWASWPDWLGTRNV